MIIKTNCLGKPDDIYAATHSGVQMVGLPFSKKNKESIKMLSSRAGIIPDYADKSLALSNKGHNKETGHPVSFIGLFDDDMPQDIVTRIYNYNISIIELDGNESAVMIENLKRTVVPDIKKELKVIKKLNVSNEEDITKWEEYKDAAEMFVFDFPATDSCSREEKLKILDKYNGSIPFLITCNKNERNVASLIQHPMFKGLDISKE